MSNNEQTALSRNTVRRRPHAISLPLTAAALLGQECVEGQQQAPKCLALEKEQSASARSCCPVLL